MDKKVSLKERLRKKTVENTSIKNSKIVEYMGEKFEIRLPSIKETQKLIDNCQYYDFEQNIKVDALKNVMLTIIHSVYVPGTDERVFDEEDLESFQNNPQGSYVSFFSEQLNDFILEFGEGKKKDLNTLVS